MMTAVFMGAGVACLVLAIRMKSFSDHVRSALFVLGVGLGLVGLLILGSQ